LRRGGGDSGWRRGSGTGRQCDTLTETSLGHVNLTAGDDRAVCDKSDSAVVGVNACGGRRLVALDFSHDLHEVAALDLLSVDSVAFGVKVVETLRNAGVAVGDDPVARPAFLVHVLIALLVRHGGVAIVDFPREVRANRHTVVSGAERGNGRKPRCGYAIDEAERRISLPVGMAGGLRVSHAEIDGWARLTGIRTGFDDFQVALVVMGLEHCQGAGDESADRRSDVESCFLYHVSLLQIYAEPSTGTVE
jgi:hypothetical protein